MSAEQDNHQYSVNEILSEFGYGTKSEVDEATKATLQEEKDLLNGPETKATCDPCVPESSEIESSPTEEMSLSKEIKPESVYDLCAPGRQSGTDSFSDGETVISDDIERGKRTGGGLKIFLILAGVVAVFVVFIVTVNYLNTRCCVEDCWEKAESPYGCCWSHVCQDPDCVRPVSSVLSKHCEEHQICKWNGCSSSRTSSEFCSEHEELGEWANMIKNGYDVLFSKLENTLGDDAFEEAMSEAGGMKLVGSGVELEVRYKGSNDYFHYKYVPTSSTSAWFFKNGRLIGTASMQYGEDDTEDWVMAAAFWTLYIGYGKELESRLESKGEAEVEIHTTNLKEIADYLGYNYISG